MRLPFMEPLINNHRSITSLRMSQRYVLPGKNIKINYVSKKFQHSCWKKKTETGYLTVSSPELTAADLLQFDKRIGGSTARLRCSMS